MNQVNFFLLKYDCNGHYNGFQNGRYGNYSQFLVALSIVGELNPDFAFKLVKKLLLAYTNKRLPG